MNEDPRRILRLLIVEDNPIDVRLLRYAFTFQQQWDISITVAEDGERAVAMLLEASPAPDYIILDLNLPKRDGAEVLQVIRATERLEKTPVAVVSSSPLDVMQDRVTGAKVNADFYFTKPMQVDGFVELAKKLIESYQQTRASATVPGLIEAGN